MFKIIRKEILNSFVTLMEIEAPNVSKHCEPGQFIILRVDENGERIPLTIADYNRDKGTVTIVFQIVGLTTSKLNEKNIGEYILDFVGPLGKATELNDYKKVIIVGGGVGCAIAYPIAKKCHELGMHVDTIIGFRNKDLIIFEKEFEEVSDNLTIMTDDGSYGDKGVVTEPLKKILSIDNYDCVITIGPLIMMKYVALTTKEYNVKTIASMNPIMIDGTGMCGGCRLTVGGKMKFACVDGPDFDAHEIDFDEAMSRMNMYKKAETEKRDKWCNLMKAGEHNA